MANAGDKAKAETKKDEKTVNAGVWIDPTASTAKIAKTGGKPAPPAIDATKAERQKWQSDMVQYLSGQLEKSKMSPEAQTKMKATLARDNLSEDEISTCAAKVLAE